MSKISEKVEEFIAPIVEALEKEIEIVEVEFAKKYNFKFLLQLYLRHNQNVF